MSESLQQDHSGQMHHGGQESTLAVSTPVRNGHGHHGFLAHLLGLDHSYSVHGSHAVHQHRQNAGVDKPQTVADTVQGLKLSDALQGINITPNMLFLLLFASFFVWLYVVYFIRHHDPLAQQVLGTGAAYSATAPADIKIVSGMRKALPIRPSSASGAMFIPVTPLPGQAQAATLAAPVTSYGTQAYVPTTSMRAYHLSVQTPEGMRLKTVVNR